MNIFLISIKSLWHRRLTISLLILSLALSSMLLIGIEKIKVSAKTSFSRSISDADLIVGPRSGEIQLLLYTVFRKGQPVANISWKSLQDISKLPEVAWMVPVSLGDSHIGYPVLGTSLEYFARYKYGRKQKLELKEGEVFKTVQDSVIGAEVATKLNYKLNDVIFLSHGTEKGPLDQHEEHGFKITGILKPTGTPVDKTVHIFLEGITSLHMDEEEHGPKTDLTPKSVTGAFLGMKNKFSIFNIQRKITAWKNEPLMAIIPAVALSRLWSTIASVEVALFIINLMVILIALIGLLMTLFMSLQQRQREIAVLRTIGARPSHIFFLLVIESLFITVTGVILGIIAMLVSGYFLQPILEYKFGLLVPLTEVGANEIFLGIGLIMAGLVTSLVPAWMAYRTSLSKGIVTL